jgi:hypothetical protein
MDYHEIEENRGEGAKRRKTLDEQIEELRHKKEDLAKQLGAKEARKKQTARKIDTRRKIIRGAVAEAHANVSSGFGEELAGAVRAAVTRPQDRALFPEYFPEYAMSPMPPAAPLESRGEPPSSALPVPTLAGRPGPRPVSKGPRPGQRG